MIDHPVALALAQCGGIATWAQLCSRCSAHAVKKAARDGVIERARRGSYVLPGLTDAFRAAASLGGVVSHRSAALAHGWPVWVAPRRPEVTVSRERRIGSDRRRAAILRFRQLEPGSTEDLLTSPARTVLDCARDLPFAEALAVTDSALRSGLVTAEDLDLLVLPRVGRARATEVFGYASPLAAGPLESVLRAISLEAVGPLFTPQEPVILGDHRIRPDLVCRDLRMVLEADSFEYHTSRDRIRSDCWRYDELTLTDWLALRFAWDHVWFAPDWVQGTVVRGVQRQRRLLAA